MLRLPDASGAPFLVLMGGGVDSAVAVAWLRSLGHSLQALHFDYGQKTRARELQCARDLCAWYGLAPPLTAPVPLLSALGGHAMLQGGTPLDSERPACAYVPFRNTIMLSLAAAWAEHHDFGSIVIGSHASDRVCPDNSHGYVTAFQRLADVALLRERPIKVLAPFVPITKQCVVALGLELDVPLHLTWSCYNQTAQACGTCGNCRDRLDAFAGCGVRDPIPYQGVA